MKQKQEYQNNLRKHPFCSIIIAFILPKEPSLCLFPLSFPVDVIKAAINHKGLSIVDIFQPCVTFNKINTYKWYQENTYIMENHDKSDRRAALEKAFETEKYPLGILYETQRETFEELTPGNRGFKEPLFKRTLNRELLKEELDMFA
jgi:2-oxoglutarate ferredoxin oxidoreductase subunit beta